MGYCHHRRLEGCDRTISRRACGENKQINGWRNERNNIWHGAVQREDLENKLDFRVLFCFILFWSASLLCCFIVFWDLIY